MTWEILLLILGGILSLVGIAGSIFPFIPGPPLNWIALLLLQLTSRHPFTTRFLLTWALITAAVVVLDYVIPIYGTKKFGGTRKGVWGSTIGLLAGMFFFPPFGIIIGPFLGAFIGELAAGKNSGEAFRAGFGSFIGFLAGTLMKLVLSIIMTWHFFVHIG
jgi:uncharacterized protein YqgC (DUF456 family)